MARGIAPILSAGLQEKKKERPMNPPLDKNQPVTIYYFSGTGNTQIVANKMAECFAEKGFSAKAVRIEDVKSITIDESEIIGIGFPIAACSTYPLVFQFIRNLPGAHRNPLFAFCTMAGISLWAIEGELKTILENKGYLPIGFHEFIMPPNIFAQIPESMRRARIERSFLHALQFVNQLIDGNSRWRKIPLLSRLMFVLCSALFKLAEMPFHQKLFKMRVENDKCNKCGICVRKCPAGNIVLTSKVMIGDRCQYCFRCVGICPATAVFGILSPKSLHYWAENARL
jgi:ferredoxin/flavodoxin